MVKPIVESPITPSRTATLRFPVQAVRVVGGSAAGDEGDSTPFLIDSGAERTRRFIVPLVVPPAPVSDECDEADYVVEISGPIASPL